MGGVHTLIAKIAPDLEDFLDTADQKPLEIQFQRDPQVEIQVIGIHVGLERPGVGATMHRLQHRRFDLDETARMQLLAQRARHGAPCLGHPPCGRINDQINVTMAYPRFHVTQAAVLIRQRPKTLRGDRELVGEHRQLTPARGDDLAVYPDVIAEVNVLLPGRQHVGTDAVQGDHDLDVPGPVADRREAELPAVSRQHHPPGHAHPFTGGRARLQRGIARAQLTDRVGPGETSGVRVDPGREQALTLGQPDLHLLWHLLWQVFLHLDEATGGQPAVRTQFPAPPATGARPWPDM